MTSRVQYAERSRDIQDGFERHVLDKIAFDKKAGHSVTVKGTGTQDDDAPMLVGNVGFKLKNGTNAEVFLLSGGSDTNMKFALVTIPRDKQREWKEGRGGVQNPMDPTHALEFKDGNLHLTKGTFTVGNGTIEVTDGKINIRSDVTITGKLTVNGGVVSPIFGVGSESVPGYTPT
jgi:phage baseplate assembly protein gpV